MKVANWRTTIAGVAALIGTLGTQVSNLLDEDPATAFDWSIMWATIIAIGLLFAKDHDK